LILKYDILLSLFSCFQILLFQIQLVPLQRGGSVHGVWAQLLGHPVGAGDRTDRL
jgi:hypothetical protein